jgi:diguanylate cyclase (GGDEF)-like protein
MEKIKILIVEDEGLTGSYIKRILVGLGYTVTSIEFSGEEAIERAGEDKPDLVLMDIKLQGKIDGIEAAEAIRTRYNIPVVYLTAHSDDAMLQRAKVTEPFGYVIKPFESRELHSNIEMALYKHQIENRLKHLAHYDPLTSLPNRALFIDRLNCILSQAKRDKQNFALLYIDLDGFKFINDSKGHDVGDLLLAEVAKRLIAAVRESDSVARIGGDEFTVILRNITQKTDAALFAERLIETLGKPYLCGDKQCVVGASVGISFYPEDGGNSELLMKKSDIAMYHAKAFGKNNYQYFVKASEEFNKLILFAGDFVLEKKGLWNHTDWLNLLYEAQKKGFDLTGARVQAAFGMLLEGLKKIYFTVNLKNPERLVEILCNETADLIKSLKNPCNHNELIETLAAFEKAKIHLKPEATQCIDEILEAVRSIYWLITHRINLQTVKMES